MTKLIAQIKSQSWSWLKPVLRMTRSCLLALFFCRTTKHLAKTHPWFNPSLSPNTVYVLIVVHKRKRHGPKTLSNS